MTRHTRGAVRLTASFAAVLALAGCSRGEGPAGLGSADAIADAFGCVGVEQVGTVPHTPDEYSCTSADQPVIIFRADPESAEAVRDYLQEETEHDDVAQVTEEWYITCADEATCTAIEHDLDVTFS